MLQKRSIKMRAHRNTKTLGWNSSHTLKQIFIEVDSTEIGISLIKKSHILKNIKNHYFNWFCLPYCMFTCGFTWITSHHTLLRIQHSMPCNCNACRNPPFFMFANVERHNQGDLSIEVTFHCWWNYNMFSFCHVIHILW